MEKRIRDTAFHKVTSNKLPLHYSGLNVSNIWLLKTDRKIKLCLFTSWSVWYMFDSASAAQPSGGGGGYKVTNVIVYVSTRKRQKKVCFAYSPDNHLSENSRSILANLLSFHTKRCYRKARLLQKNSIKNNEVHASPPPPPKKKTSPFLVKTFLYRFRML